MLFFLRISRYFLALQPLASLSIFLCYFFAITPSLAMAKKEAYALQIVSTTAYIDLRTGPGQGYPIFHVIEKGETITLLKQKTDWFKVRTHNGHEGWVHRKKLRDTIGANGESVELGFDGRELYNTRRWEFGGGIGEFERVESLGFHIGYRFTNNLMAEVRFSQATGSFTINRLYSLGLVHQTFPSWRYSPYFTMGAGTINVDTNASLPQPSDPDDEIIFIGIGNYFYTGRKFMGRIEYTKYTSLPSSNDNRTFEEWRIGLVAFLN